MLSSEIQKVIQVLSKMPGLGQRSARRMVLHLLKHQEKYLDPLVFSLIKMKETIKVCSVCYTYDTENLCVICSDSQRDKKTICVVQDVADLWALERTGWVKGGYHVLGGVLSALDGVTPEDLHVPQLLERVQRERVQEVILALNATLEGQTTAHYLCSLLKDVKVTALAHGVPLGGELDYMDEGTLTTALSTRRPLYPS